MARERQIKQVMTVYTEIVTRLVDKSFRFSQGGITIRAISKFLDEFEKEYGIITKERLVDFCICAAHTFREREKWTIQQVFGPKSQTRFRESKQGKVYYEDNWLSEAQLTRDYLYNLIADRKEHPQAKYIHVLSEESTKKRLLNQKIGYLLCQTSTLGWSPVSETCEQCNFQQDCKKETQSKYPELYRIRLEYGKPKE
ncbi:hypothetical protein [Bacteroides sp. 224]|uniref:hypothetical protein n=1 Tax=Bacteroides sp. 224 TaxID=2302936 RepID=UPI001EF3D417|nr:hypothetical protein [Bacteroides sp. 224]